MVICLERGADLHMVQLIPLSLTVSCFSKIQISFTFLVPAHLGSPGKRAAKWVCVCVHLFVRACVCVFAAILWLVGLPVYQFAIYLFRSIKWRPLPTRSDWNFSVRSLARRSTMSGRKRRKQFWKRQVNIAVHICMVRTRPSQVDSSAVLFPYWICFPTAVVYSLVWLIVLGAPESFWLDALLFESVWFRSC